MSVHGEFCDSNVDWWGSICQRGRKNKECWYALPYPSAVVNHRSSFGSRTSSVFKPSGSLLNTTTSGAVDGARITSTSVPSVRLPGEQPSPFAEADVAILILGGMRAPLARTVAGSSARKAATADVLRMIRDTIGFKSYCIWQEGEGQNLIQRCVHSGYSYSKAKRETSLRVHAGFSSCRLRTLRVGSDSGKTGRERVWLWDPS